MQRPTRRSTRRSLLGALLPLIAASPAAAQQATLTGTLHVLWADGPSGSEAAGERYLLVDDAGSATELLLSAAELESSGGVLALNRRRVTVAAARRPDGGGAPVAAASLRAAVAGPRLSLATGAAQVGQKPFVTLLCRFGDTPTTEPRPRATYERWLMLQVDHVVPLGVAKSHGVPLDLYEDMFNLVLACAGCNGFDNRYRYRVDLPPRATWTVEEFVVLRDAVFAERYGRIEARRADEQAFFDKLPEMLGGPAPALGGD